MTIKTGASSAYVPDISKRSINSRFTSASVTTTMLPPWLKPPEGARRMTPAIRSICSRGIAPGRNARCIRRRRRMLRNSTPRTVYGRRHDEIRGEDGGGDRRREGNRRGDGAAARVGRGDGRRRGLRRRRREEDGGGDRRPR